MIRIGKDVIKKQKNFWNNCIFHPTDAVEDSWGRKILDCMAEDNAIQSVRIYTMFEDIVYLDGNGELAYDFRLNDLRLDYLLDKGYDVLLAYAMMPECIASSKNAKSTVCKNSTRYKGKFINTSPPTDYALWEKVCYEYTKHIVERYGEEVVSKWHLQCFNEPDCPLFFMSDVEGAGLKERAEEYCKLYKAFADGVTAACDKLCIGGPAMTDEFDFLEMFLKYIKENNVRLDYISYHNYARTGVYRIMHENWKLDIDNWEYHHNGIINVMEKYGFGDTEIVVDEWGMAGQGFCNIEDCPPFIARETEAFAAYYVKLVHTIIKRGWNISKMMLCLTGQHEMVTDFSGFRNFFTLNFFKKPIYNAFVMASRLHEGLLDAGADNENIYVIPTTDEKGNYSVLLTYASKNFEQDLPVIKEELSILGISPGKKVALYLIDNETTNPYRLYEKEKMTPDLSDGQISALRKEGELKVLSEFSAEEKIELSLTPNCVYLIEVK